MITETKSISIADRVFEQLENDILSGKYPAGSNLTELKISSELGVSRTPVREALKRLEQENLVSEIGKRLVVNGVTNEDLRDVYDIRMRIEGLAAARVASLATKEQLDALKDALELHEFYTSKAYIDQIKTTDTKFHSLIFEFCGSVILRDILKLLHRRIEHFRQMSIEDNARATKAAAEHREIYNAIAAGDSALAEKLTVEHIHNALNNILSKQNTKEN